MLGNLSPSQALGAASAREGAKENSSFPSTEVRALEVGPPVASPHVVLIL